MTSRLWRRRARPVLLCAAAVALLAAGTLGAVQPTAAAQAAGSTAASAGSAPVNLAGAPFGDLLAGLVPALVAAAPAAGTTSVAPAVDDGTSPGASGIPTRPYTDCIDTTGVPYATGLPPLPCYLFPYQVPGSAGSLTGYSDFGALLSDLRQQAPKARLLLNLPDTVSRVFTIICNAPVNGAPAFRPCPPQFPFTYPTDPTVAIGFFGTGAYVFAQSPLTASGDPVLASEPQFGVITQVRVPVLAFGSVPGTAVLTVRQRVVDGYVEPIKLTVPSIGTLYPPGTTVPGYGRFGPNPFDEPANISDDVKATGAISITVSDVTIDGVPLDVGSNCTTDSTLNLYARGGWISSGTVDAVEGQPGEYAPFDPPGYLHAGFVDGPQGIDVPAFSGCVGGASGTEDLSPLITGLVSGPGNELDLTQVTQFVPFGCLPVKNPSARCQQSHPAVVPPGSVQNRSDG